MQDTHRPIYTLVLAFKGEHMNDIPIGSLWTHKPTGTRRMVLSVTEAQDPPTGVKLIVYHAMDSNSTLMLMARTGDWLYDCVLIST